MSDPNIRARDRMIRRALRARRAKHGKTNPAVPRRRKSDRWGGRFERLERIVALVLVALAVGGVWLERGERQAADAASVAERKAIACTVRGVLEVSRDRAAATGTLDADSRELYRAALKDLRTDCPPLFRPVDDPARGRPRP
jgi:hypothetical protein